MTTVRTSLVIILSIMISVCACNYLAPAGFWNQFEVEYLKENNSDHGPWGGHRAMFWKADLENTFTSNQIIRFANKNGWVFVDSLHFQSDDIKNWIVKGKDIFPLTHDGLIADIIFTSSTMENFPRWIVTGLSVLSFKTGKVAIHPGTDDFNLINGFVIISDDGKEVAVYHLWGE